MTFAVRLWLGRRNLNSGAALRLSKVLSKNKKPRSQRRKQSNLQDLHKIMHVQSAQDQTVLLLALAMALRRAKQAAKTAVEELEELRLVKRLYKCRQRSATEVDRQRLRWQWADLTANFTEAVMVELRVEVEHHFQLIQGEVETHDDANDDSFVVPRRL